MLRYSHSIAAYHVSVSCSLVARKMSNTQYSGVGYYTRLILKVFRKDIVVQWKARKTTQDEARGVRWSVSISEMNEDALCICIFFFLSLLLFKWRCVDRRHA